MANLFWKQKGRKTLNLVSVPFTSEEEFERAVFETKGLLQEVYLLKRQVRGGRKSGVPDIIGVHYKNPSSFSSKYRKNKLSG